ncbi:MAG: hypothetical protein PHN51_11825 [Candidatus Nanopelagicales bacterium]|nr:hypothetical protein [Candidatus Nanopelagicales bacterium]
MAVNGQPTLLDQVRNVITTYKGTVGDGMSIADVTKIARVEPITLISSNLTGQKDLYNVLHGVLNIYMAYYLQAVQILSSQLYDSRILKILDKTNPDRDIKTFLTSGQLAFESDSSLNLMAEAGVSPSLAVRTMSLRGCEHRLPMVNRGLVSSGLVHVESAMLNNYGYGNGAGEEYSENEDLNRNTGLDSAVPRIQGFDKLGMSIGKIVEVSFTTGETSTRQFKSDKKTLDTNTVRIPVVIKLDTMIIPSDAIAGITTMNADEITLGSRARAALDGRIDIIKDFILCSDLIKQQKKAMIKDGTGFYAQLLKRINSSKLYSILSGNISLAGVSAIYVMSDEDEAEIQRKIGGRLSNLTTRNMVFNNTSAMMLVVIDKAWERVSIYVRDMDGFSQGSIDSFKPMSDKNNNNIGDILKAFSLSQGQVF